MVEVQYFKATKKTHRWNENQKVWISLNCPNHLYIYHRFRGRGRYVTGIVDKHKTDMVGEIKTIEVDEVFAKRIRRVR